MHIQRYFLLIFGCLILVVSCNADELPGPDPNPGGTTTDTIPENDDVPEDGGEDEGGSEEIEMYFPTAAGGDWNTLEPDSLGWNTGQLDDLLGSLEKNNTRAFMILYRGHIVVERYWGTAYESTAQFDENTDWYWASAGKSLTAFLMGLAEQQGFLSIEDRTSDYLGEAWSSLPSQKEELITLRNHLTMTTGLDYSVDDFCSDPACLKYKADAGSFWYYHNAPYNLLDDILADAVGTSYEAFSREVLEDPIGMSGEWRYFDDYNNIYWSTARDAARFGLLMLNKGEWDGTPVMSDSTYFESMVSPSQDLNPSYGYLWWINGEEEIILPGSEAPVPGFFTPDAPAQMYVAAGLNGQFIDVVPQLDLVVVRLGEAPNGKQVPRDLHNELWEYLKMVIGYAAKPQL